MLTALHDVGQATYAPTDTDFTAQVSQMKAAGAQYVFLTTFAKRHSKNHCNRSCQDPQWILQSPGILAPVAGVPSLVPAASPSLGPNPREQPGAIRASWYETDAADVAKYAPEPEAGWFL